MKVKDGKLQYASVDALLNDLEEIFMTQCGGLSVTAYKVEVHYNIIGDRPPITRAKLERKRAVDESIWDGPCPESYSDDVFDRHFTNGAIPQRRRRRKKPNEDVQGND